MMKIAIPEKHAEKFKEFICICEDIKNKGFVDAIAIDFPAVLGDTYEEVLLNLALVAECEALLIITEANPMDLPTAERSLE